MRYVLPLLALRNMVVMPNSVTSFVVTRKFSCAAVDAAMAEDGNIIFVAQKSPEVEHPVEDDLFSVATLGKIKQIMRLKDGNLRIMVEGAKRVELCEVLQDNPYYVAAAVSYANIEPEDMKRSIALARSLQELSERYLSVTKLVKGDEFINRVSGINTLGGFCDFLTSTSNLVFTVKQQLLELSNVEERAETLIALLNYELDIIALQNDIKSRVREKIEKNQKEYFLREEKRIIEEELGEGIETEAEQYRQRINALNLNEEVREKLMKEVLRFEKTSGMNADSSVFRNYLDTVLELPWNIKTTENLDIANARRVLDEDHYGLEKVKERVIEQLAVRKLTEGRQGTLICLAGPPGTGKTSIARSIARASNRKYVRVALGGVHDEAEIRGHRKTYIGAMPGRIIAAIAQAKNSNPLILLDEIDKLSNDVKGDPSSALLEVLDYEQNREFKDNYIDVPFDLSDVMFVTTANDISHIPAPLRDRLEIIEISGYTNNEKLEIAKNYLLPKQIKECGLDNKKINITDTALLMICNNYTREAGVRQTERVIASLLRKIAKQFIEENRRSITVNEKNLTKYIGKKKYHYDVMNEEDQVGIVRGLAWTAAGGDTLSVEVNVMDGTGKTELTGQLGDVMQESAKTAISYIRSISNPLGIESDFYKTKDIHIHVPEGAVPKDGPSAGVTLATAVASALTGKAIRRDVAMTGEITLRGRVLPIGGLKEKAIAAYRAGISTVLIPDANKPDLDDVPDEVKNEVKFIPVKDMHSVLRHSFANE